MRELEKERKVVLLVVHDFLEIFPQISSQRDICKKTALLAFCNAKVANLRLCLSKTYSLWLGFVRIERPDFQIVEIMSRQ